MPEREKKRKIGRKLSKNSTEKFLGIERHHSWDWGCPCIPITMNKKDPHEAHNYEILDNEWE